MVPKSEISFFCLKTFVFFVVVGRESFFQRNQSLVSKPTGWHTPSGRVFGLFGQLELYKCHRVEVILVGETQIFGFSMVFQSFECRSFLHQLETKGWVGVLMVVNV